MMNKEHINLTAIRFFRKVAQCGNITQAANELFITQPVLSRYIKELEKETGVTLFQRLKYGVALTEEGQRFYEHATELENSVETFCNQVAALNGTHFYNLKVGYQKSSERLMIAANSAYVSRYPEAVIGVTRQEDVNFKKMLRQHLLSIAFNSASEFNDGDQDIEYAELLQIPQLLMVSKDNPIAQMDRVHFSKLRDQKWVLPTTESLPHKQAAILQCCRLHNFEPKIIAYERQYSNYIIDVVTNNAIAILSYVREVALANPHVAFVPLDGFPCNTGIGLMWLKKEADPAIESYVEVARQIAKQMQMETPR